MAQEPGKHVVVRAARAAEEKDEIDKAFDELKDADRAKLGEARAKHRAAAVLLHEIGHTLGAIHARDRASLMHPSYDTQMSSYGDPAAALMRAGLAHRQDAPAMARALLSALAATPPETWVDADRASLEARLNAVVGPLGPASAPAAAPSAPAPTTPAAAEEPAPPALPDDVAALPADARGRFIEAARALAAGDAATADAKGRSLYAAHPKVVSVQDLRCKIAVAKGGAWDETKKECDPLMKLSLGK
jgi:hypothetical protein